MCFSCVSFTSIHEYLKKAREFYYFSIVNRALSRVVGDMYVEKHHIIPKSLGGSNDKSNLVKLTAKEHFCVIDF
jgi:hypothetical protein